MMEDETDSETDETTNNYDYSNLPQHIITNILSYLPVYQITNAASVCHTWYNASLSVEITKKIAVYFYGNHNLNEYLDTEINWRPFGNVHFFCFKFSEQDYQSFLNKYYKNVRHIEFMDCYIKFNQLCECIELLPNLESLTIRTNNNSKINVDFSVKITDVLEQNLSGIKTLSINCHNMNAFAGGNFILSKCKNLDYLTYTIPIHPISNEGVKEIYENMIIAMDQWRRVDLKYLSLENRGPSSCDAFFTSFQMLNVIRINKLNLRNIRTNYDAKSFNQFLAGMYDISDLSVDIQTHSNLLYICKYLPSLKRLSINSMTTKSIGIIEDLHNLEVLDVSAFDVSQEDLLKLFKARMPNLRKLHLNIMVLNKTCLIALCNNFKRLEYLNVTLNTKCYYPIFNNLHNLKHLTIYMEENWEDVDDDLTDCNISKLQKLKRLWFNVFVPGITTDDIAMLPNLKFYFMPKQE